MGYKAQLSNAAGFIDVFQAVVAILPGPLATGLSWLIAIAVILSLAASGGTWLMGADRTYAVTALDGTAPAALGRFSGHYGTPLITNLLSGVVATIAMVAAILVTAFGSGTLVTLFTLVLGFTISTTALSYIFIFVSYLVLRYKYRDVPRPYTVPGGMVGAWILTLLSIAYVAVAGFFTLIPTDDTIKDTQLSRFTYELTQFIPILLVLLVAGVFYLLGQREQRSKGVVVEEEPQIALNVQGAEGD